MWPDSSGIEYLNGILLAVGAKDPTASGVPAHRVSYLREWGPPSSDPADRIYRTWETQPNGAPFVDDDGDFDPFTGNQVIDEDFLDGRDNDGDGLIDEDFGALGHETYTCVMRDDGPYSVPNGGEAHVPLGLECRQMAWDYGASGLDNFVAARYQIFNRSGHTLDSVFVGFLVDMDAGARSTPNYWSDDRDLPGYPSGEFLRVLGPSELQRQYPHSPALNADVPAESALCPRVLVRVNGFSLVDDNGDGGLTPGVASFLLLDHTVDPLGISAPQRVGFRAFRSFLGGTPYSAGGNPTLDSQRYEFMSGTENVDPVTGFVTSQPGAAPGDYVEWCSIGPFLNVADGGSFEVTIGFAVRPGNLSEALGYPADYAAYRAGTMGSAALFAAHPALDQAYAIQKARDGVYEHRQGPLVPSFHGRETAVRLPRGAPPMFMFDCRTGPRLVNDLHEEWFDFDCDYCTGAWDAATQTGLFHRIWNVSTALLDVPEASAHGGVPGPRIVALGPNPARGEARLSFLLTAGARTEVDVFDLEGRVVQRILDAHLAAGPHEIVWDGRDAAGARVAPGLYMWRVRSGGREAVSKSVHLD
jgi:hypothetical protein